MKQIVHGSHCKWKIRNDIVGLVGILVILPCPKQWTFSSAGVRAGSEPTKLHRPRHLVFEQITLHTIIYIEATQPLTSAFPGIEHGVRTAQFLSEAKEIAQSIVFAVQAQRPKLNRSTQKIK